jgi:hypothetical protein
MRKGLQRRPARGAGWTITAPALCSANVAKAGDDGTAGNAGGAALDRGDVADDHRGRATGLLPQQGEAFPPLSTPGEPVSPREVSRIQEVAQGRSISSPRWKPEMVPLRCDDASSWRMPPTSATFARRSCSHSFSLAPASRLPRWPIGWCSNSSERDDRHGALLDADMTADALLLMEHQLKHGETGAPRSWTSTC